MGYIDIERREAGAFSILAGNPLAVAVALAGLAIAVASVANGAYDNDLWWILATGREIVEAGIPFTNPFSVDTGQSIIVQQWLHDVLYWEVYSVFGMSGVNRLVLALSCVLADGMSRVAVVFGDYKERCKAVPLLAAFIAFSLATMYVGSRPQVWTMLACCAVLLFSRRFSLSGDGRWLIPLPFVAFLHSNLHSSMLALDAFILLVVIVPTAWSYRFEDGWAHKWVAPVVFTLVLSFIASCINPYGFNAPLYLLHSLGAASYGDMIQEMGSVELASAWGVIAGIMSAVTAGLALARRQLQPYSPLEISCAVLMCAGLIAFFGAVRNVWVFAVLWLPFTIQMLSTLDLVPLSERAKRVMSAPAVVIAILIGGYLAACCIAISDIAAYPTSIEQATDVAEADIPTAEVAFLSSMKDSVYSNSVMPLWNGFDVGGYLEFEGFKVSLDQRPELWEDAITRDDRRDYRDYVDAFKGDTIAAARSLEGRDVALVDANEANISSYLNNTSDWQKADITNATEGWSVYVRQNTAAAQYVAGISDDRGGE